MADALRALFLVAEATPFIKVGGLGDVGGSLPSAIQRAGGEHLEMRVAIPHHNAILLDEQRAQRLPDVTVKTRSGSLRAEIHSVEQDGLTVYLIGGEPVKRSPAVYQADAGLDGRKFTFFSLAALELARRLDWPPDILHANDWHAAPAVTALKTRYRRQSFFAKTRSILTLHNLPYMGNGRYYPDFGLVDKDPGELPAWAQSLPLPLGLLHADRIVAVSPSYARGILSEAFGCGLQDFLQTRQEDILGILNGLDYRLWDPVHDPRLEQPYTSRKLQQRVANKLALQEEVGLPVHAGIPLLGMVSRLDPQKGIDLAFEALRAIDDRNWQFILVGTGDPALEDAARKLQADYPERVWTVLRYDDRLAHAVYAGSDLLLMPSRYEPCGLAQMIAMRYGCIPVATPVGGLLDSIQDPPSGTRRTGFLADAVEPAAFAAAIRRGLAALQDSDGWLTLQRRAMRQDFSWDRSAEKYLKLYRSLTG